MTLHPFLQDQENLRAFQQLTAAPTGSVRKWELLLNWKPGRLQRFLSSLVKYGLAEVTSCRQHTTFRPLTDEPLQSATIRYSPLHPNQEQFKSSGLSNRLRKKPAERQDGAPELVAVMNRILCANHPMDYLPVPTSQDGSHLAARLWLVENEIPLPDAIDILTAKCAAFNPHKINGDMPRSLGFFTKSVLAEWRRILRDRQQLKLFPKLEMHVEPRVSEYKPEPAGPVAAPAVIAATMAQLEREIPRPRRMK